MAYASFSAGNVQEEPARLDLSREQRRHQALLGPLEGPLEGALSAKGGTI